MFFVQITIAYNLEEKSEKTLKSIFLLLYYFLNTNHKVLFKCSSVYQHLYTYSIHLSLD